MPDAKRGDHRSRRPWESRSGTCKERPDTELAGILDDRYAELHVENGLYRGPSAAAEELARLHPDAKFVLAVGKTASDSSCMNALVFRLTGMRF